jgi:hypothetical protein
MMQSCCDAGKCSKGSSDAERGETMYASVRSLKALVATALPSGV